MIVQEGEQDLPKQIEDIDRVNLGTVVSTARDFKLLTQMIKSFENQTGSKIRKVNKNGAKVLQQLITSKKY